MFSPWGKDFTVKINIIFPWAEAKFCLDEFHKNIVGQIWFFFFFAWVSFLEIIRKYSHKHVSFFSVETFKIKIKYCSAAFIIQIWQQYMYIVILPLCTKIFSFIAISFTSACPNYFHKQQSFKQPLKWNYFYC